MAHIHAKLMAQYTEDALETDKPWERWEFSCQKQEYKTLWDHPTWHEKNKYRRKPKVILINGHEVPEPHRTPLKDGEVYWALSLFSGAASLRWKDDDFDNSYLENGFVHLTRDAAEKHYEAIRSLTAKGEQ